MRHVRYKDSTSLEKTTYEKDVFEGSFDYIPTWKHIKHIKFQDDDKIQANWDKYDDSYYVCVTRWVEETDEEWQERLADMKRSEESAKERRRQSYLRLKAEFENEEHKG